MVVESSAGGTGRHVLDLCQGLLSRGCDVHLLYSTIRFDRAFEIRLSRARERGLRAVPLPMRTTIHPSDFGVVRFARRYLREQGPFDAVHGHSSKGGAIARLTALGTRTPSFYTLHGLIMMDSGLARWKRAFYLAIEILLSWRTARIIAVSPEEMRAAMRLGLGRSRVTLVPNGIGELNLAPRDRARATLGVDADTVLIGFVGRLVDQKAPHVLIEAFARAARVAPHARLALVGDGPLSDEMRDLARHQGVGDKVLFLGERDARELLSGFDVFAISSRKEGLPYVVLEAMAAELPVVATASAGVEILVESGTNGMVVPTDDVTAFASALTSLLTDSSGRQSCGQASRVRAKRFSLDAMVDRTLAVYYAARESRPVNAEPDRDDDVEVPATA
jgi:glycosyltransferase involved in cell wall biosynthesis